MPTVAVVGASADRRKFGNKAVRAYAHRGWMVHPIHPSAETIEGLPAHASVRDVPGPLDRITVYLPPAVGVSILEDLAAVEHGDLYFNPGTESPEVLARARQLGLKPIEACSIIVIGESPASYD